MTTKTKCILSAFTLMSLSCAASFAVSADGSLPSEIVYQESFDGSKLPSGWSGAINSIFAQGEGPDGGNCLKFVVEKGKESKTFLASIDLDAEKLSGKAIIIESMVKGENITKPGTQYLGPKVMIHYKTSDSENWIDQPGAKTYGSSDWKKSSLFIRLPSGIRKIDLSVGLQDSAGTFWVGNLKVRAIPQAEAPLSAAISKTPLQKTPALRGVMSGAKLDEPDIKTLADWNVNMMRFQIGNPKRQDVSTPENVDLWLNEQLDKLDKTVPLCKKYGVKILIDLHSGPGMKQTELLNNRLSWTKESQDELVRIWRFMASKYKDEEIVWGYDILNEPREDDYMGENLDWNRLAERVAKAIREIDTVKPIIVEPPPWASPEGFKSFKPIDVSNVIYSVHFYMPGSFTHQGVHGRPTGIVYPGVIEGKKWDKDAMEKALAPVIEFQRKYNVPIYVGEFSVIRWAPGDSGAQWLRDAIEIFEANGWDWSYHAFREYDGWDSEMGSDPADKTRLASTPRKDLLLQYFKLNKKP